MEEKSQKFTLSTMDHFRGFLILGLNHFLYSLEGYATYRQLEWTGIGLLKCCIIWWIIPNQCKMNAYSYRIIYIHVPPLLIGEISLDLA